MRGWDLKKGEQRHYYPKRLIMVKGAPQVMLLGFYSIFGRFLIFRHVMCSGSIRRMETSLGQGVGNIVLQTSTLQFLNHN